MTPRAKRIPTHILADLAHASLIAATRQLDQTSPTSDTTTTRWWERLRRRITQADGFVLHLRNRAHKEGKCPN